jgi:CheY-like chemotaxis protein
MHWPPSFHGLHLIWFKLEAGKVELEARPFDPRELVRSVVELLRPRASQKQLELSAEIATEIAPQLIGDSSRLRQVLLNLVANAIKFTPAGEVRLRLGLDAEGRCRFTVEDTGIGMSPEQIGRLFKPFEQGSASTHRTHGGTGLGLAISARLVEAMGGTIGVVSNLGHGSRFDFAITMAFSDAPVVRAAPKARAPSGRGQGLVLIVDDNDTNRRVAEAMVRKLGHPTCLAKDGEEALKLLGEIPVAAVLMDWQMPVLDGLSATRMLRARPGPERSTPIIALTASAMHEEVTACIDAGMNEVLAKPLTLNALAGSLGRWAGERRPE